MKTVSRFEANLLRLLHCLLQRAPLDQALPLLVKPPPRPECLSADAVALVQDALAKGTVWLLARRGWRRERFLRDGRPVEGRLWERTEPAALGLTFSRHALEFLIQLTAGALGSGNAPPAKELTVGDRLVFLLALEALHENELGEKLVKGWPPLHRDGLARLLFLEELADRETGTYRIDWAPWTTGVGASILEAMQPRLVEAWLRLERRKGHISDPARMRRIGRTQHRVWGEFLTAIGAAGRRDLARCFLQTAQRLLNDNPPAARWIGQLQLRGERLADRVEIYQAALAFLRQLGRLHEWDQEFRAVGYFDEGYPASQLWKADWETWQGEASCDRAGDILREVEPLRA